MCSPTALHACSLLRRGTSIQEKRKEQLFDQACLSPESYKLNQENIGIAHRLDILLSPIYQGFVSLVCPLFLPPCFLCFRWCFLLLGWGFFWHPCIPFFFFLMNLFAISKTNIKGSIPHSTKNSNYERLLTIPKSGFPNAFIVLLKFSNWKNHF